MIKVSIIIPIYNTEKYLRRCLDSVVEQTLKDIEIICVNDGSEDSSLKIIQDYAERDGRIRIINKPNEGLVSARKAGINIAQGKYIGYVDSDDWIDKEMYEILYSLAEEYGADLVSSGYVFEGDYISYYMDGLREGLYCGDGIKYLRENAIYNIQTQQVGLRGSLCCKLFLTEKFKNIQLEIPNEMTVSEDKMCVISYTLKCERVYILNDAFYHYIKYESSMSHAANNNYLSKVDVVYNYLNKLYNHVKFTKAMRLQAEIYITEMLYKGINSRLGFENKNILWIDPYWLNSIPKNSKIILFGTGQIIDVYRMQLLNCKDLQLVLCTDKPEPILELQFDYVVITVKNEKKASQEIETLTSMGVPHEKILWFNQEEIYWKFAKACGYLESEK